MNERAALARLAERLGGTASGDERVARGTYRGVAIVHRLVARGIGSSSTSWTEIECPRPAPPVALHVVPHALRDRAKVKHGNMVDLVLGDRRFDRRFRVEAAPEAVVRRAISPGVRGYFVRRRGDELETVGEVLRLSCFGRILDVDRAAAAWDVLVAVEHGIRTAHEAIDAAAVAPPGGSPFRAEPDAERLGRSQAARADEVVEIERIRAQRIARQARTRAVVFWIVTLVAVLGLVAGMIASRGGP